MLTHYCFKDVLPKEFCDGMLSVARELDSKEAEVFKEGDDVVLSEIRNNRVAWLANDELSEILELYVDIANERAGWDFSLTSFEVPQISFYGKGQFYNWHVDTGVEKQSDPYFRKLAISITLNDEFKGGDFQVQNFVHPQAPNRFRTVKAMRRQGSIVVFPSFIFHRITTVSEGERSAMTCWFRGEKFS
tara:strand:- start:133 stop:699 length:567 start_codon:yes stop_codon:yes gene_type:complete